MSVGHITAAGTLLALVAGVAGAAASALPRSAELSFAGLGPVRIGMTGARAERAAGRPLDVSPIAGDGSCGTAAIGPGATALFTGDRLARIYLSSRRHATGSGLRIGTTTRRVLETYGGRVVREPHK